MYNEINKRKQANLNKNKRKRGKVHQRKINKLWNGILQIPRMKRKHSYKYWIALTEEHEILSKYLFLKKLYKQSDKRIQKLDIRNEFTRRRSKSFSESVKLRLKMNLELTFSLTEEMYKRIQGIQSAKY